MNINTCPCIEGFKRQLSHHSNWHVCAGINVTWSKCLLHFFCSFPFSFLWFDLFPRDYVSCIVRLSLMFFRVIGNASSLQWVDIIWTSHARIINLLLRLCTMNILLPDYPKSLANILNNFCFGIASTVIFYSRVTISRLNPMCPSPEFTRCFLKNRTAVITNACGLG